MWWKKTQNDEYQMTQQDLLIALEQRRRADRAKDRAIEQGEKLDALTDEFTRAMKKSFRGRHA